MSTSTSAPGEMISKEYGLKGVWIQKPFLALVYGDENKDVLDSREKMKKAPEGNNIITFHLPTIADELKITDVRLKRAIRKGDLNVKTTNLPPEAGEGARMKFEFTHGSEKYEIIKIRYGGN